MTSTSTILGAAGEHQVMSALLRRNYIAALAPQGVPNADIVVTDLEGKRLCTVQVKTRRDIGRDGGWHMKAKHEEFVSDKLFYCFVDFGKSDQDVPKIFVLPSKVVAKVLKESHLAWLARPGKKGQPHKDGPMRRLLPDYSREFGPHSNQHSKGWLDQYRDAWGQLGLEVSAIQP